MAPLTNFTNWRPNIARQKLKNVEVENKLIKDKMAIEESEHFKSSFLNNMSHDMRTPLNCMLGLAQLILRSEDVSPKVQYNVKMIIENGNRLLTMLNNIIDETKLNTGQIKLRKSSLCLNSLMDRLYNLFLESPVYMRKNELGQNNIELKREKPSKNIAIMCDPERVLQILVNLIDNALKFTKKGTVLFGYKTPTSNASSKEQHITFYVKDTGVGIPNDKTEKILEPFVQLDATMSRQYNAAGLGLPISKRLVDMMNGKIWCESEVGKGTSFYFSIPYVPAYASPNWDNGDEDEPQKNDAVRDWSGYTVLIAEDDISCFKALGGMLRNTKVNIIHSDNGVKAIEQVRLNPKIDLVLMNVNLPNINGLEATEKILEINPTLPVIAQTFDEKEKYVESGFIDYISKPVDANILFNKLSKFLL